MNSDNSNSNSTAVAKIPILAAVVSFIGLADAIYLTINHFTGEQVPCSILEGCEQVLTSAYATIGEIPIAAIGALAYFFAFSLSVLAAYGNKIAWNVFGAHVSLMAIVTVWLIYLQAFVIGAFCQFCLLSALVTFFLFAIFFVSKFTQRNAS